MAIYNVNKDTGDITETAGKYGSSNSVFYGTIAEWNQLSTAEKKAYDHASLTGTGGGEYNVDKTTGDLVPTSGMPSEYPASKVMLSDGVTDVEAALTNIESKIHTGYGTNVNIIGYNSSSNYYTCPADGVVFANNGKAETNTYCYVTSITRGSLIIIKCIGNGNNNMIMTTPVLKNEKIYVGATSGASAIFTPYI